MAIGDSTCVDGAGECDAVASVALRSFLYFSSSSFPIFLEMVFARAMTTTMTTDMVFAQLPALYSEYNVWEQFCPFVHTKTCIVEVRKIRSNGQHGNKKDIGVRLANGKLASSRARVKCGQRKNGSHWEIQEAAAYIGEQLGVAGIYVGGERLSLRAQKVLGTIYYTHKCMSCM